MISTPSIAALPPAPTRRISATASSLFASTSAWLVAALFVASLGLPACGDVGGSCARRTTGLAGDGPGCDNSLECADDLWVLDCDEATGMCACTLNGETLMTIPYDDTFCPVDFGTADFDAHYLAARDACGWP